MLDVLVYSDSVRTRNITSKKTGEVMTFRDQEAFLVHPSKPFPVPFHLQLDREAAAYRSGKYRICPDSVFVGQYGDLQFAKRLQLERTGELDKQQPSGRAA